MGEVTVRKGTSVVQLEALDKGFVLFSYATTDQLNNQVIIPIVDVQ